MKQVNELSPQTAYRAQAGAAKLAADDPRRQQQVQTFGAYGQKQTAKAPDLRFTVQRDDGQPKNVVAAIVGSPTKKTSYGRFGDGHVVYVKDSAGEGMALFVSVSRRPYQVFSVAHGLEDKVFLDRPSAVKVAKLLGLKPTDFAMQARPTPAPAASPAAKPEPEYSVENLMKEDLTVQSFSLKHIIENMEKIPEKTGKFGEPSNTLSLGEKKKMLEMLGRFGKHGQSLRGDTAIREAAKELSELANMAKKYAMNENNSDFIQKETVQRDFKQMDGIVKEFQKLAQECVSKQNQLAALYEDYGNIMERYYSMDEINETGTPGAVPEDVQTELNMSECGTCGCGNPNHDHGVSMTPAEEGMM